MRWENIYNSPWKGVGTSQKSTIGHFVSFYGLFVSDQGCTEYVVYDASVSQ